MSKLTLLHKIIKIDNFREIFQRFLLPVICIILNASLLMMFACDAIYKDQIKIALLFSSLFTSSCFALTALKLYCENNQQKNSKYLIYSLYTTLALAYVIFCEPVFESFSLTAGLFLSIIIAPFFRKNIEDSAQCNFSYKFLSSIFFAIIIALILAAGTTAIYFTTDLLLFGKALPSSGFAILAILCFCFFAPVYVLANIPKEFDFAQHSYSKGIKFLIARILLPLVLAYLAILYIYMAKILIFAELPKGVLAPMILCFGIIGIATHFLSHNLQESGGIFLKNFYRYFYHSLLVPIALLFWSALIRINQYGITEERYWILMVATWFGVSAIYMILIKTRSLKFIPILLCALCIFTSFGPWRVSAISELSQSKRLESLLEEKGILKDGKIIKLTDKMTSDYNRQVSEIVDYLVNTNKVKTIAKLSPGVIKDYTYLYGSETLSNLDSVKIMSDIGLTYTSKWNSGASINKYNFRPEKLLSIYDSALSVKGFDYITAFNFHQPAEIKDPNGDVSFNISIEKNYLIISKNNLAKAKFDLLKFAENLQNSYQQQDDFVINYQDPNFQIKIYVTNLEIDDLGNSSAIINRFECLILIK